MAYYEQVILLRTLFAFFGHVIDAKEAFNIVSTHTEYLKYLIDI